MSVASSQITLHHKLKSFSRFDALRVVEAPILTRPQKTIRLARILPREAARSVSTEALQPRVRGTIIYSRGNSFRGDLPIRVQGVIQLFSSNGLQTLGTRRVAMRRLVEMEAALVGGGEQTLAQHLLAGVLGQLQVVHACVHRGVRAVACVHLPHDSKARV